MGNLEDRFSVDSIASAIEACQQGTNQELAEIAGECAPAKMIDQIFKAVKATLQPFALEVGDFRFFLSNLNADSGSGSAEIKVDSEHYLKSDSKGDVLDEDDNPTNRLPSTLGKIRINSKGEVAVSIYEKQDYEKLFPDTAEGQTQAALFNGSVTVLKKNILKLNK